MAEWEELMKNKVFITDLGEIQNAIIKEQPVKVGRYAVWSPIANSKNHQVIEVSETLEYLQQKYHIPEDRICRLIACQ